MANLLNRRRMLQTTALAGFGIWACPGNGAAEPPAVSGANGPEALPVSPSAILVTGTNMPGDAARINAAIAASPEGAEIVIRGTCLIDEPIRLRGNRSYRGESRTGTVLKQADGANLAALMASSVFLDDKAWTGTPVAIRHLRLDGNHKGDPDSTTAGIVLRSWLSVVEDVHIRGMGSDGLRLTNLSADETGLQATQVNGRIANCFVERAGRHGIFVQDTQNAVTDWILTDCWIASSGVDGIHLDNAAGWFVERNHIYGVPQNAIFAHRMFATSISDNYIEGFGECEESGRWHEIYGTLQGGSGCTIANNRIFNFRGERQEESEYRYLALTVNYGTATAVVANNVIRGSGQPRGTAMYYSAQGDRKLLVTSNGNAVADVAEPGVVEGNVVLQPGLQVESHVLLVQILAVNLELGDSVVSQRESLLKIDQSHPRTFLFCKSELLRLRRVSQRNGHPFSVGKLQCRTGPRLFLAIVLMQHDDDSFGLHFTTELHHQPQISTSSRPPVSAGCTLPVDRVVGRTLRSIPVM